MTPDRAGSFHSGLSRAVALTLACGVCAQPGVSRAEELNVPDRFDTIQAAIDAAASGDVVMVEPGTYTENLTLTLISEIDVLGQETARTLLQPATAGATIVIAGATDVTIANFTLIDATDAMVVEGSTDITVASIVFDAASGIALTTDDTSTVEVINNVFHGNATAIRRASAETTVTNNIFAGNTSTLTSPLNLGGTPAVIAGANVSFNCFYDNGDIDEGAEGAELGENPQTEDPAFADVEARDFHLQQGSPCIDSGADTGMDVIDATDADIGAYGGDFADPFPFPPGAPTATDVSAATPPAAISLSWPANLSHRVTNDIDPGGYRIYYDSDASGPEYDGTDAAGGQEPSSIDVGPETSWELSDLSPAAPALSAPTLSAFPGSETVRLDWTAVTDADGYRVLYGISAVDENGLDVGNVTSFTVTGLENEQSYRFAVAALAQPMYYLAVSAVDNTPEQNESALSEEVSVAVNDPVPGATSSEVTATPGDVTPFPDLPDKSCFVATAAFGAEWTAEVRILRDFRDRSLTATAPGRALVRGYYAVGPVAADFLHRHPALKPAVRLMLLPFVAGAAFVLAAPPLAKTAVMLLCVAGVVSMLRRRRRGCVPGRAEGQP